MTGSERPSVTLIVPVRNESSAISDCLGALAAQTYDGALEIVVVDGESDDATPSIVDSWSQRDPRIRLLPNPARNMPAGLNLGIEHSRGELVGVISGHSVPSRDYVARAVHALSRTGAWSVGGQIIRVATSPLQRAIAHATSSPLGVGDSRHNYETEASWVETVFPGMWPRWVFERIGMFDPRMVANEDNEFSFRIHRAGGRVWFDPDIRVRYIPRGSLASLFDQYRRYGFGKMRVWRKHHGGLRLRHLVPPAWVVWLVFGGVLSPLQPTIAIIWATSIVAYVALIVGAAMLAADKQTPWWLIATSFTTLHISYGIGMWQGIMDRTRVS
jgi:glycosyltransferase involved in cell wall biosynthesis